MLSKFKEKFSNSNKLTKLLFKYGFVFSYVIFCIGIYLLISAADYQANFIAQQTIKASLSVFSEFAISAIFFDLLSNS